MYLAQPQIEVMRVVTTAADAAGVPRRVALAFAWCESRFDADSEGDLTWHERDGGERYKKHVLHNSRFALNPWRRTPELWHAYGIFQLLACYFARPMENPRHLLDPVVNAERGCAEIRRLLTLTKNNTDAARLWYVGCGPTGSQCTEAVRASYLARLHSALALFGNA